MEPFETDDDDLSDSDRYDEWVFQQQRDWPLADEVDPTELVHLFR